MGHLSIRPSSRKVTFTEPEQEVTLKIKIGNEYKKLLNLLFFSNLVFPPAVITNLQIANRSGYFDGSVPVGLFEKSTNEHGLEINEQLETDREIEVTLKEDSGASAQDFVPYSVFLIANLSR